MNGGGAVTLQFQRSPFKPLTRTVFVPWNQIVVLPPVVMALNEEGESHKSNQPPSPAVGEYELEIVYFSFCFSAFLSHFVVSRIINFDDPEKVSHVCNGLFQLQSFAFSFCLLSVTLLVALMR